MSAAVALPLERRPRWLGALRDSKQLNPTQRERLSPLIRAGADGWALGWVHAAELDALGMTRALRAAARRAVDALDPAPDIVLADGRDDLQLPWPTEMIVRGDARVSSIAAASIIAKVGRDAWMRQLAERYPGYGFAQHKGYGSAQHLRALRALGPCAEHRRSFAPVREQIERQLRLVSLNPANMDAERLAESLDVTD